MPSSFLLFSGWGFDHHIFNNLTFKDPTFTVAYCGKSTVDTYIQHHNPSKPKAIIGFSMGAFLAIEYAQKMQFLDCPIILIGASCGYPPLTLSAFKKQLSKHQEQFLEQFYKSCFDGNQQLTWEKTTRIHDIYPPYHQDRLQEGLTHLGELTLKKDQLETFSKLAFIHGLNDKIASFIEIKQFLEGSSYPLFTCPGGHFPDPETLQPILDNLLK